jgi:predicted negative regulator of RcsB-dependent stress response
LASLELAQQFVDKNDLQNAEKQLQQAWLPRLMIT